MSKKLQSLESQLTPLVDLDGIEVEDNAYFTNANKLCGDLYTLLNQVEKHVVEATRLLSLNYSILSYPDLEILLHQTYPNEINAPWQKDKLKSVREAFSRLAAIEVKLKWQNDWVSPKEKLIEFEQATTYLTDLFENVQDYLLFISVVLKEQQQISFKTGRSLLTDLAFA